MKTLLQQFEEAYHPSWEPNEYNDSKNGVCPNDRRFDRRDEERHWFKKDELDQELDFND